MTLKDFLNFHIKDIELLTIELPNGCEIFKGYIEELKYVRIDKYLDCIVYKHKFNWEKGHVYLGVR